jgi:cytochrome c oxidase subunit 2
MIGISCVLAFVTFAMQEMRVPVSLVARLLSIDQLQGGKNYGANLAIRIRERLRTLAIARTSDAENGRREMSMLRKSSTVRFLAQAILLLFWSATTVWASAPKGSSAHGTNIFSPASTPAKSIKDLSVFVLVVTGMIFVVVFTLLVSSVVKFRGRAVDAGREPAQVYGSTQIELAWTIIPTLIVIVLFLATARVIHAIQDVPVSAGGLEVTAIGHQYWWEFRYPKLGIVTANELHIPVSDPSHPTPTFLQLLSADTDHSFWVPELAGKTDLIPNHPNRMWMDPQRTGVFLGQCAQYCGTQHAKMLLRVSVDRPEDFAAWVRAQQSLAVEDAGAIAGRRAFERNACMNCHSVGGTPADGRFGPDLTHLMSRATIAAGAAQNTHDNLRLWIQNPSAIKPGSLMPAMKLSDADLDAVVSYMETLH